MHEFVLHISKCIYNTTENNQSSRGGPKQSTVKQLKMKFEDFIVEQNSIYYNTFYSGQCEFTSHARFN